MNASTKETSMRALIVDDECHENTAIGRALRMLAGHLEESGVAITSASHPDRFCRINAEQALLPQATFRAFCT
jgi:hypothetical protein